MSLAPNLIINGRVIITPSPLNLVILGVPSCPIARRKHLLSHPGCLCDSFYQHFRHLLAGPWPGPLCLYTGFVDFTPCVAKSSQLQLAGFRCVNSSSSRRLMELESKWKLVKGISTNIYMKLQYCWSRFWAAVGLCNTLKWIQKSFTFLIPLKSVQIGAL